MPRYSNKPPKVERPQWVDRSVPADSHFAMLCSKSLTMWMAGAHPEKIAEWLETKQDGCIVNLADQVFAVRGLKPYRPWGLQLPRVGSKSIIAASP